MTKIYVSKLSETYIHVESEEEIELNITEHFSFLVDGYRFMPAFKNGKWDGYIRLYNPNIKKLYAGLLSSLIEFAEIYNHQIVYDDSLNLEQEYSDEYITEWLDNQLLHAHGEEIFMRDYQYDVVFQFLKHKRLVIRAATSSGKSLIIYLICKFFIEHNKKILVQTDSTNLVEQLYNDFLDYSILNKFDVESNTQKITASYSKELTKPIAISTWQSQYSSLKKDVNHINDYFDVIINDETHKADAKSITAIFESCHDISWRIGLTGSLKKTKLNKLALEGLIGRVYKSITTRELIDRGESCNLNINILMLDYDSDTKKIIKKEKFDYPKLSELIRLCDERNRFLVKLAATKKGNSLILFNHEEHGLELLRIHNELFPDIPVFFINKNILGKEREKIRKQIEELEKCTVIGSYGTVSTGWSVKRLHNLIMGFPYKSVTRILQTLGRMLRTHESKKIANVYDISDILSNSKTAIFNRQTQARAEIYIEEKLKFKTFKIEIKTNALF